MTPFPTDHSGFPSQLKYRKDLSKMKGTSHFHSLTSEDNLALKNARKINKIVSEVGELVGRDDSNNNNRHPVLFMVFGDALVAPQRRGGGPRQRQRLLSSVDWRPGGTVSLLSRHTLTPPLGIFHMSDMPVGCCGSFPPKATGDPFKLMSLHSVMAPVKTGSIAYMNVSR